MKNHVSLIGNVGMTPEIREFEKGKKLARFSVATKDVYKNQKGERVEETTWHNIVCFGVKVDTIEKYVSKGQQIAIEGKLVNNSYEDKDGNKKYSTQINLNDFFLLGGKNDSK